MTEKTPERKLIEQCAANVIGVPIRSDGAELQRYVTARYLSSIEHHEDGELMTWNLDRWVQHAFGWMTSWRQAEARARVRSTVVVDDEVCGVGYGGKQRLQANLEPWEIVTPEEERHMEETEASDPGPEPEAPPAVQHRRRQLGT